MRKTIDKKIMSLILLFLVTSLAFLSSPIFKKLISDDSGVFLYSAWRILNGDILYKDIWDHKPPLIHFMNVLAIVLNQKSLWGLWLIQLFYLASSVLIGFEVMALSFGLLPATIASIAWILSPAILLGDGNHTQDYALFYQFAILYLFFKKNKGDRKSFYSYLIGMCGGIIILFQPNISTIFISVLVYECISVILKKNSPKSLLINISGMLSIFSLMGIYFHLTKSFYYFYQAVIVYNRYYSYTSFTHLFQSIYTGLLLNILSCLLLFTVSGIILAVKNNIFKKTDGGSVIVRIALIALPFEIVLTTISGRDALHYYTSWLPVFAIFSAYGIKRIRNKYNFFNNTFVIVIVLVSMMIGPIYTITILTKVTNERNIILSNKHSKVIAYLDKKIDENDMVLIWGVEPRINFVAKRKSASRFAYQFALFTKHYATPELIDSFISDLNKNKPKYIIDAPIYKGYMPALNKKKRNQWKAPLPNYLQVPEINRIYKYVENYYSIETTIEDWTIYRRKN